MRTTVTVQAERSEGWWVITSDEVQGLVSQARRLDQVPEQVRDALLLLPEADVDPATVEVDVDVVASLPGLTEAEEARELVAAARAAQEGASVAMRTAARALKEAGLPVRDIGTVLGVSFQRAQKLATAEAAA